MLAAYQSYTVVSTWMILLVGLIVLVGLAIVYTAVRNRRHVAESDVKICAGCATPHPTTAQFCRKCGKKLG